MSSERGKSERNKQVIKDYWAAIMAGDMERMLSFIADDAKLQTIGDMPICGFRSKRDFIDAMLIMSRTFAGPGVVHLGEIVAEGDVVIAEAEGHYKTTEGRDYNGQYIYVYYVRDGKIVGLKEYADTLHSYEMFPNDLTRGPRIKRESNVWNTSGVVEGLMSVAEKTYTPGSGGR
jgi:ketosteroid isomerase-like protein